jgi:hypothetical protein
VQGIGNREQGVEDWRRIVDCLAGVLFAATEMAKGARLNLVPERKM